jgi:2-methylcitrate dehydratase PrpD
MTNATQRLAVFALNHRPPPAIRARAIASILDTIAVTAAGFAEEPVRRLNRALGNPAGVEAGFARRDGLGAADYAQLVGMASHILDYDDVCMLSICHPSAPVLSALLAAPVDSSVTGDAMVDAYSVGVEVMIRLGEAMGFRHYALGFHATGTLGTVGAAAACARLLGLDERRIGHALSIAASNAGGLRRNFGSMVKSLHVGNSAAAGLRAALLSAAGIEGSAEVLEHEGFLHAYSGGGADTWPETLRLGEPYALGAPGFEHKRYPCCYMMHKTIEGTLALRRTKGLLLSDIAGARVDLPHGGTKPLLHPYPVTGLHAKFSAHYAVLASLLDGRVDLSSFTDSAAQRTEIQTRLRQIDVVEGDTAPAKGGDVGDAPVTVTLTLRDGTVLAETVTASPGSPADPMTPEQSRTKWIDCWRYGTRGNDDARLDSLFETCAAVDTAPSFAQWRRKIEQAGAAPV